MAERTFTADARRRYAARGVALSDGSYPIPDCDAVRRAVASFGRAPEAKRARVKAHIIRRARALGCTSRIPEDWR